MTCYNIDINEGQRQILEKALANIPLEGRSLLSTAVGTGCGAYDTEYQEYVVLLEMIRDLPKQEADSPGVTHGLCL